MKFRYLSLATVFGGLALAACAKDQPSSPLAPTSVARTITPSALSSCNFATMRTDANWFKNTRVVKDKITAMEDAYIAGGANGAAAATDKGFDVLAHVSSALTTGNVKGTATAGDTFVKDVLACMSVSTLPDPLSFIGALSANGLFAVVGGVDDPAAGVTSRGTPRYGAEPQDGQTWFGSATPDQRYLLYGNERDFSFTAESPAAVTAFELATIPAGITFAPAIKGGICQTTVTNALIQSVSTILPLQSLNFCTGIVSVDRQDRGLFASITHGIASFLSPSPVYGFGVGGTGSLLSGLSPKAAVTFSATAAGLAFVQQPVDSRRSLRPQFPSGVSVMVTTANGTVVNGVEVTLTASNNNGSWEMFNAKATSGATGIPGLAVFPDVYTDKSGGYNFVASATIFGQPTKSAVSVRINIDGK
jgi:hypothetical protein